MYYSIITEKAETTDAVLQKAKALEANFNKRVSIEVKQIRNQVDADMQVQLQGKLRTQTATLDIWTWGIAFDRIVEKWDDRWQYYKNMGQRNLKKRYP